MNAINTAEIVTQSYKAGVAEGMLKMLSAMARATNEYDVTWHFSECGKAVCMTRHDPSTGEYKDHEYTDFNDLLAFMVGAGWI